MASDGNDKTKPEAPRGRVKELLAALGPGLVTGAADDDPSGISTYSIAGASFGLGLLWTAIFSFPLMATVQLMSARIGLVTGRGLGSVIRINFPRWVLFLASALLIIANVCNIAADLGGMADATRMITGLPFYLSASVYALLIIALLLFKTYSQIAKVLKWLSLVLFAYVISAFLARPDWYEVLWATLIPRIEFSPRFLATFVGILGTTISPYLFFWQSSQEVEDERSKGRKTVKQREGATKAELRTSTIDVTTGMFFSNLVMYFIILTTATTLHASGHTDISSTRDAAEALRPVAGDLAYLLFTIGLVGTGLLAVPVLAGSAAYAISEAKNRPGSLEDKPRVARRFYGIIVVAVLLGLMLDFIGLDAVKMLFYSAVLNGILAPPLIVLIILITTNGKVMGEHVISLPMRILGWATAAIMTLAAVAMFATM